MKKIGKRVLPDLNINIENVSKSTHHITTGA